TRLRDRLDALGDSVLVVGGGDLWNVHVHADDGGAAVQAGIDAGRPHRIAVTHFCDQQRARTAVSGYGPVAVVACAAGVGLAEVFTAAGAVSVFNGPGRRASAGQLLDAVRSAGSRCVIVLPNEGDTLLAAAAATRHGAVTVASKESLTSAGRCYPGDVVGAVDGDVVVVGKDLAVVGVEVVARLLADGGELLTVVSGAGVGPELAAEVAQAARAGRRDLEVSIIDGGQATYPLLLGVE